MTGNMIEKYIRRQDAIPSPSDQEPGETEDLGFFGWLRGIRDRAIMLELRKKDGHVMAIGYSWIERVEFEPSQGLTLHLPDQQIRIIGVGLNHEIRPSVRLLDGIIRHRVPWICEANQNDGIGAKNNKMIVESISWES